MGVLRDALPQLDPVAVQRRAVIMAILERDARLMDRVEILVRVAEHVALVPEQEIAARRNMDRMLSAAKLTGASCVRNSRADFFYGPVLLFGYTVRQGPKEAEVEMPSDVSGCRCYIGGNSWSWKFAPEMLRGELGLDEDKP
jgi:hypothetical protein